MKKDWRKHLGAICSGALRIFKFEQEGYEDIHLWKAPVECCQLVRKEAYDQKLTYWNKIKEEFGVDKDGVEKEFKHRVRYNYMVHNLCSMIFD